MSRISSVYRLNEEPRVQQSRLEANHLTARAERQRVSRGVIKSPKHKVNGWREPEFNEYRGERRHVRDV